LIVKLLGAAYLCWIGIKALQEAIRGVTAPVHVQPAKQKRALTGACIEGFLTNALNPKVSMFYLAAFPQFMTVGENAVASAFFLVFIHSLINAVWFGAMVLLFARLARLAGSGGFQRWLKGVTGIVFIGFGAKLATYKPSF
jgi:threonine/homoserine/homoserine lactone efflux protein